MINDIVYAALVLRFDGRHVVAVTAGGKSGQYRFAYEPIAQAFSVFDGSHFLGTIYRDRRTAAPEAWPLLVAFAFGDLTELT